MQSELADMIAMKRANFVALVNRLVQRGLVCRLPIEGDRRAKKLALTEKGMTLEAEARQKQVEFENILNNKLGNNANRDLLLKALDALSDWS